MIGWLVRALFVLAGLITSLFVARDELNFHIFQTIIAVFLFTLLVAILAFWPILQDRYKQIRKRFKR